MWQNNLFHSDIIAYIFMSVNVGLTILQIVWLGEIVQTGVKMFSEDGVDGLAIKRGEDEKK